MRTLNLILLCLLLGSCSKNEVCREVPAITEEVEIQIIRTEDDFFSVGTKEDLAAVLQKYPYVTRYFLGPQNYPSQEVFLQQLYETVTHDSVRLVYNEAKDAFPDLSGLESELEEAFGRLKMLYPDVTVPRVRTAVTGLYNDLVITDSLIVVGLDFFIGEDASYRPSTYDYILDGLDPEHMSSKIILRLAGQQILAGKAETMISEMIDYGKTFYLLSQLMPCTPDSILFEYTPEDMDGIDANRELIWSHFIENELLFETSQFTKSKYLMDRPNVPEIGERCPGRIGTFIGYEIVTAFMENNDLTLKELLDNTDHHKIFEQSGYKPRNTY